MLEPEHRDGENDANLDDFRLSIPDEMNIKHTKTLSGCFVESGLAFHFIVNNKLYKKTAEKEHEYFLRYYYTYTAYVIKSIGDVVCCALRNGHKTFEAQGGQTHNFLAFIEDISKERRKRKHFLEYYLSYKEEDDDRDGLKVSSFVDQKVFSDMFLQFSQKITDIRAKKQMGDKSFVCDFLESLLAEIRSKENNAGHLFVCLKKCLVILRVAFLDKTSGGSSGDVRYIEEAYDSLRASFPRIVGTQSYDTVLREETTAFAKEQKELMAFPLQYLCGSDTYKDKTHAFVRVLFELLDPSSDNDSAETDFLIRLHTKQQEMQSLLNSVANEEKNDYVAVLYDILHAYEQYAQKGECKKALVALYSDLVERNYGGWPTMASEFSSELIEEHVNLKENRLNSFHDRRLETGPVSGARRGGASRVIYIPVASYLNQKTDAISTEFISNNSDDIQRIFKEIAEGAPMDEVEHYDKLEFSVFNMWSKFVYFSKENNYLRVVSEQLQQIRYGNSWSPIKWNQKPKRSISLEGLVNFVHDLDSNANQEISRLLLSEFKK